MWLMNLYSSTHWGRNLCTNFEKGVSFSPPERRRIVRKHALPCRAIMSVATFINQKVPLPLPPFFRELPESQRELRQSDGNCVLHRTQQNSTIMLIILLWLAMTLNITRAVIINADSVLEEEQPLANAAVTLKCHRKLYTYLVSQQDENGKQCWDKISVWACWGRCDSNEISDWRFPFKKSNHPVCVHYGRNRVFVTLRHCEEGIMEGTDHYEYLEADDCKCQVCSSSDTSCEGVRYRPHRSDPDNLGFL